MTVAIGVYRTQMASPDDLSELQRLVDVKQVSPSEIVAIICKTEGNGRMNDFTRGFAAHTFKTYLADRLGISTAEVADRVALVMSGGCEGVMTPHAVVFTRTSLPSGTRPGSKGFALGVSFTRALRPEEIGRMAQVQLVADATKRALRDAAIEDEREVHFVQTKGPILTTALIQDAYSRGESVATTDTYKSMGYSNGASALGIGLALSEIDPASLNDNVICKRADLYSSVASCSAGIELMNCQVIVIGNSELSSSNSVAGHAVLRDLLDKEGVLSALSSAGLRNDGLPTQDQLDRVEAIFVKALVDQSGNLRGQRTTMLSDLDLGTRPARAVGNALIASVIGDPMAYVSAGWGFHQGPVGGGVVAIIARSDDGTVPKRAK